MKIWKIAQENTESREEQIADQKLDAIEAEIPSETTDLSPETPEKPVKSFQEYYQDLEPIKEDLIREFIEHKATIKILSEQFETPRLVIKRFLKEKLGIKKYTEIRNRNLNLFQTEVYQKKFTEAELDEMVRLYSNLVSAKEIAEKFHVCQLTVLKRVRDRIGEDNYQALIKKKLSAINRRRRRTIKQYGPKILDLFKRFVSVTDIQKRLSLFGIRNANDIRDFLRKQLGSDTFESIQKEILLRNRRLFNPSLNANPEMDKARKDHIRIRKELYDEAIDLYYRQRLSTEDIANKFSLNPLVVARFFEEVERDPSMRELVKKRQNTDVSPAVTSSSWYKKTKQMYVVAESTIDIEIPKLKQLLEDPNLQELTCVYNAKKLLDRSDFYGAIKALKVDCDKIRMINRELYDYVGEVVMPVSQDEVDRWHRIWDKQEGKT